MQLMTDMLGGDVRRSGQREFGHALVRVSGSGAAPRLFADVPAELRVWASHGDDVAAVPPGFAVAATSATAPIAAMEAAERGLYALLFHPEVVHTEHGADILRNFAYERLRLHAATGRSRRSSKKRPQRIRQQVRRRARSSAACRAASIRRSRRC